MVKYTEVNKLLFIAF